MLHAVRAKVEQHPDVRDLLPSTGNAVIVEHTLADDFWGDGGDGTGENVLGRIWMDVRAELTGGRRDVPGEERGSPR